MVDKRKVTHKRVWIENKLLAALQRKQKVKGRIPFTVLVEAALESYLGKRA